MSLRSLVLVAAVVGLCLLALFFRLRGRGGGRPWSHPDDGSAAELPPAARLVARLEEGRDYRVFVGVPVEAPATWAPATAVSGGLVVDGRKVSPTEVRSFIIAYPGGEILELVGPPHSLPAGLTSLPDAPPAADVLRRGDLEAGNELLRVLHGPSLAQPDDPRHYATTLENVSGQRLRILRFGGYARRLGGRWRLRNASGGWYTAEQFREWYGQNGEWLEPGKRVTDSNNYGGLHSLWAYYFETDSGRRLVAGAVVGD